MKSKLLSLFSSILLCFLFTGYLHAGQPLWTQSMKTTILWQKVTPSGQLLASTAKGLVGINTDSGDELWVIEDLKNSPEKGYEVISGSPFVSMYSAEGNTNMVIVDPFKGKIIFSSKEAGLEKVTDKYFLYQSGKILVIGTSATGKNTEMVMVEMSNGTSLWHKRGAYSFTTGVKDLGNNEVLITSAFFASRINAQTGDEVWKASLDPRTAGMSSLMVMLEGPLSKKLTKEEIMAQLITTDYAPGIFIIAAQKKTESTKTDSKGNKTVSISYSSVYMAFETQSGKYKWEKVIEQKFPLGISYPTSKGLIVCSADDGNINMLSYDDGSSLLGKKGSGLRLKGTASGVAPIDETKLLMVAGGKNSTVDVLDLNTGLLTFDKAAKIKGIVSYTEIYSNGVLIGTDEEVNFLNHNTGEWYMDKAFEGGAGLISSDRELCYVFNTDDRLLYFKDAKSTEFTQMGSAPLEFQGKEEPTSIEITDKGIIISSDQNIAMIDRTGNIIFNKYFPAPTESGFKKALLIASAVRAAYYTAAYATYSAAFGAASQSIEVKDAQSKATKDVTGEISKAFGGAATTGANYTAEYIKMASHRFKATTNTQDYMLIMTSESKKDTKLLQVSKFSGDVTNTIQLGKDKEPIYDVDLVEGRLYYMKSATEMECYKL